MRKGRSPNASSRITEPNKRDTHYFLINFSNQLIIRSWTLLWSDESCMIVCEPPAPTRMHLSLIKGPHTCSHFFRERGKFLYVYLGKISRESLGSGVFWGFINPMVTNSPIRGYIFPRDTGVSMMENEQRYPLIIRECVCGRGVGMAICVLRFGLGITFSREREVRDVIITYNHVSLVDLVSFIGY